MSKGFVFTLDILIGLGFLIMIIFSFIFLEFESVFPERQYEELNYAADDIMNLLSHLKVRAIKDKLTIGRLIENGILNENDLNKTVLDLIGSFWYGKNETIAENISKEVLGELDDICVSLITGRETIYSLCNSSTQNVAVRTKIASGYEVGKPVSGYIARAWVTKSIKNTTSVFPFNPAGSGNAAGSESTLKITKKFYLNTTNIYDGKLYVALHTGIATLHSQNKFLVNGVDYAQKDYIGKQTQVVEDIIKEDNRIIFYKSNITKDLKSGWNEIKLILFKQAASIPTHIHPGTRVTVTYKTDEQRIFSQTENETLYFDNIESPGKSSIKERGGVWAITPIYVPKDSVVKHVTLHLRGLNINDEDDKDDVQIYFNNISVYNESKPDSTYDLYLNLTSYVSESKNQTNVLSIYMDTFNNEFWGGKDKTVILYSDPQNNPRGSSYIYIQYEVPPSFKKYGFLDVNLEESFTGNKSNPKNHTTDFGNREIAQSFLHIAQLDSENVSVHVQPYLEDSVEVFRSPMSSITPSSIYIDPPYFNMLKNNTIVIKDECTDKCEFLNESSLEYRIYIPSQVGYGDVFENQTEAIEDAKKRLEDILTDYIGLINWDLEIRDPSIVGGIRWLWGPSLFKVVVWR